MYYYTTTLTQSLINFKAGICFISLPANVFSHTLTSFFASSLATFRSILPSLLVSLSLSEEFFFL